MKRTYIAAILFAITASSVNAQQPTAVVGAQYGTAPNGYQSYQTQVPQYQLQQAQQGYQQQIQQAYQPQTYAPQKQTFVPQQNSIPTYYYPHQQPAASGVVIQPLSATSPELQSVLQSDSQPLQAQQAQQAQPNQAYLALPTKARPPAPSIPPQPGELLAGQSVMNRDSLLNGDRTEEPTTSAPLASSTSPAAPAPAIPTQPEAIVVPSETDVVANQQEPLPSEVPVAPTTSESEAPSNLAVVPQANAVKESLQTVDERIVKELTSTDLSPTIKDLRGFNELAATKELAATEEPAVSEEPAVVEEPAIVEELAVVEESAVIEAPSDVKELVSDLEGVNAQELAVDGAEVDELADAGMAKFGLSDEPEQPNQKLESTLEETSPAESEIAVATTPNVIKDETQLAPIQSPVERKIKAAAPITAKAPITARKKVAVTKSPAPVGNRRSSTSYGSWILGLIGFMAVPIVGWFIVRKRRRDAQDARFADAALQRVNTYKAKHTESQTASRSSATETVADKTAAPVAATPATPATAAIASAKVKAPVTTTVEPRSAKPRSAEPQETTTAKTPASATVAPPEAAPATGILSMDDLKDVELEGSDFNSPVSADSAISSPSAERPVTRGIARTEVQTEMIDSAARDSFTSITGIDVATQTALHNAGYLSFGDLAKASEREIQLALSKLDHGCSSSNFTRWTAQATLAAQGDSKSVEVSETAPVATATPVVSATPQPVSEPTTQADDLTKIRGIGPGTAELLRTAGITTFAALSKTGTPRLQEILDSGGAKFAVVDPSMWCRQAEFALGGKTARVPAATIPLPAEPKAEAQPVVSATQADDLTKIAGIGAEAQEMLRDNGINSFQQVGQMTADELNQLLASQGSQFQGLTATTWPMQARALTTQLVEEESLLDQVNSIIDIATTSSAQTKSSAPAVDAVSEQTTSKQ